MYLSPRFLSVVLFLILIYMLYRILWKGEGWGFFRFWKKKKNFSQNQSQKQEKNTGLVIAQMRKDPVCGTYIPENQAISHKFAGEMHFFCSETCLQKFKEQK